LQKHGKPAVLRRVVPLLFVSGLIILGLAGFVSQIFWWILAAVLVTYALGLVYGSIDVGRQVGWGYSLLAPIVFAILHFAYGIGSLWGFIRFVVLRGKGMQNPKDVKLTR